MKADTVITRRSAFEWDVRVHRTGRFLDPSDMGDYTELFRSRMQARQFVNRMIDEGGCLVGNSLHLAQSINYGDC